MSNPGALGSASIGGTLVPDVGGAGKGALGGAAISGLVGGLHQVVICNGNGAQGQPPGFGGFAIQPGGGMPYTLEWNGHLGIGQAWAPVPSVLQDTDGFTGTPGDWQNLGPIYSVTVPATLGGPYRIGFEQVNINTTWWPDDGPGGIPDAHPPAPIATAYVPGHGTVNPGDGQMPFGITWSCTYDIRVNGASVASYTASGVEGPPGYNQSPEAYMDVSGIALAGGDVVSLTLTWNNVWSLANFWGAVFGSGGYVPAVFYMTRGVGGGTQHGPVGTGHYGL